MIQVFEISINNRSREFLVYRSQIVKRPPLIISMHGFGGNMYQQASSTNMHNDLSSTTVVYPNGYLSSWNINAFWEFHDEDDSLFVSKIIDFVDNKIGIDKRRVYVCGMSNGGYMAYRLACELSTKIVAFGSVTGNFIPVSMCDNIIAKPNILHIHGVNDQIVNYYQPTFDGSLTAIESMNYWASKNNLTKLVEYDLSDSIHVFNFTRTNPYSQFIHYQTKGGHTWQHTNLQTNQQLFAFFSQFSFQLLGDVDGNGKLDILDIIIMVNFILKKKYSTLSDVNEDNLLNILDIVALVQEILA